MCTLPSWWQAESCRNKYNTNTPFCLAYALGFVLFDTSVNLTQILAKVNMQCAVTDLGLLEVPGDIDTVFLQPVDT